MNFNKPVIISVVLAVVSAFSAIYFFNRNLRLKEENKYLSDVIESNPQRTTEKFIDSVTIPIYKEKDTLITKYKIVYRKQHNNVLESSIPETYLDSVAKALAIGKKAVTRVNKIKASADAKLKKKDLVIKKKEKKIKELEKEIWYWKSDKAEVYANLTDSTARVKYNASISVTDYSKKPSLWANREYYTAISTPDKDLTINGYQTYEQKMNVQCSKFGLGGYAGYGAQLNNGIITVGPQVGFGLTLDLF